MLYTLEFITYDEPQFIETNCNSFQIINYGDRPAIIEKQIVLQQNQTLSITGNEGEITNKTLSLSFDTTIGTVQKVAFIKKVLL